MKLTAKLYEAELRKIVGDHLGVDQSNVTFRASSAEQDGPFFTPASVWCEVEDVDPAKLPKR